MLLLSVLSYFRASAQETNEPKSLVGILVELQEQYGYRFNYASRTIENIELPPPGKELTFDQIIDYLQQQTGLLFSALPNNFVSIKKPVLRLCGYLKNKDTRKAIAYGTVQAENTSVITDENGFFELAIAHENETIRFRHVGYKTLNINFVFFKKEGCGTTYLNPQQQQLSEIVLYDYLTRGIDKLDNGSFEINFKQFNILPGLIENDVLQSVQALPGIQSINETVSNINIRGGTHDQNLILWDDIKMYQSGHFFGLISMYNPQITQKVSLRKNGTPSAYTDGISGTMAMETEKTINSKFKGNIGVNFIDANGFADVPLGKNSSVQVAARKSISDFIVTPTYSEYFDRISQDTEVADNTNNVRNSDESFDFYDTSLRWLYKPSENDEIRLNFINASNELVFNENAEEEIRESSLSQNSIAGGIRYRRTWNDALSTTLNAYETYYKLKAINANILNDQRFLQENKVSETGARISTAYRFQERFRWVNGYQFVETKVTNLDDVDDPIFIRLVGEVLRTHGVFSELGYTSENRRTNLNVGLRFNYLDKFKKQLWEPRLSFNQRFLEWFNIEILGEFKHQNTSQIINFQNDFLGVEKRRWQLSDDDGIPVITSKQASVGLSYGKNGWLLNTVGYYKKVEGITSQSQGFQNQLEFAKTKGSYNALGMDVLVRKQFGGANVWFSYSYLESEYTFEQLPEPIFPGNFDVAHTLSMGMTYSLERFHFSTGLNWRSGRPTTLPVLGNPVLDETINYDVINRTRLDDYMRVDISAIYQFNLGKQSRVDLGLSILNLLDRENTHHAFYRVNALGEAEEIVQHSLGITPNAVFRVYF
ncbi:TonB-dependent receptor plug [hydrothermal vent metagenome]|uniref:TonB-dependent receptor plug n=1 Tax=hydrothermal vent metagenome TaxID=652676 RepID=A0A3B0TJH4_9ZZZZ